MPQRLPPDLAWPVKPAALTAALGSVSASVDVAWMAWLRQASPTLLRVTWSPERPSGTGATLQERSAGLWVPPVAQQQVDVIRPLVLQRVLPQAKVWLEDALSAGNAWQASRHERTWKLVDGRLEHRDRDGVETLRSPG